MLSSKVIKFSYWLCIEIIGVLFCYTSYDIIYFYFLPFSFTFGDYLKVSKGSAMDVGFWFQAILQVQMTYKISHIMTYRTSSLPSHSLE